MTMVLSGSNGITFPDSTDQGTGYANGIGFRNRIINGDMRIDQRNAGAAVTPDGSAPYSLDRWRTQNTTDGAFTVQQVTDAPSGFTNSLKATTTTADASLTGTQGARIWQPIEGFNVSDLDFGTANAKTFTLSFWIKSSLTGTFGGAFSGSTEYYPFTYSISVVDTWEYKTVTVVGSTSGTWNTTNGIGLNVWFGLGSGPDRSGTAGAWTTSTVTTATGVVNPISTLNATWYITGVQLEVGSVATPFERRPYGTELAWCQRYYQKSYAQATVPGTSVTSSFNGLVWSNGVCDSGAGQILPFTAFLSQPMRAIPTLSYWDAAGNASKFSSFTGGAFARTDNQGGLGSTYLNSDALIAGYGTPGASNSFALAYAVSAEL
jgi:hypothetical protein